MKWTLTVSGETWQGRPLSAEAVRRFLRMLADGRPEDAAIGWLLRRSFPLSWRSVLAHLWRGDPVRKVVADPLRVMRVQAFLALPKEVEEPVVEDEWDRLRRLQQDPVKEPGPRVTLDRVCRITEAVFGSDWYWNPRRWPTWDGYAPYDVVWRGWETLQMTRALERLNLVRAIGITKAGDKAQGLFDADVREALGG